MHITKRMNESPESHDLKAYEYWEAGMRATAAQDARQTVKQELDTHNSIVMKCEAEVDAAEAKMLVAETSLSKTELKLSTCEGELAKCKQDLARLRLEQSPIETDNMNLKLTIAERDLSIAGLEGQLKVKPKVAKNQASKAAKIVIPSFDFKPTRNAEGRIMGMTATPIGMN